MTGALHRYKKDPNGKNRGGGLYYHRGNGNYSKYSSHRDAKVKNMASQNKPSRKGHAHQGDWVKSGLGGWI